MAAHATRCEDVTFGGTALERSSLTEEVYWLGRAKLHVLSGIEILRYLELHYGARQDSTACTKPAFNRGEAGHLWPSCLNK